MEKNFSYLENVLFILFDKFESNPNQMGKKLACCIKKAINTMYPDKRYKHDIYDQKRIREDWLAQLIIGLKEGFSEHD